MPLTGRAKADYQRELMKQRRAKTETHPDSEGPPGVIVPPGATRGQVAKPWNGKPYRNQNGELVVRPGDGSCVEHYWGWVSKAPEGTRICAAFEFYGPGRWIGGCGEVRAWEGKALNSNGDGSPDLGAAIIDSAHFKEIQSKMPVTKARER